MISYILFFTFIQSNQLFLGDVLNKYSMIFCNLHRKNLRYDSLKLFRATVE